jgi:hypothetical protein
MPGTNDWSENWKEGLTMTALLSKAMKRIELLPQEQQDEIAEWLLEDLDDELKWQETLAKPQAKLDKLARRALNESDAGQTEKRGFDEL